MEFFNFFLKQIEIKCSFLVVDAVVAWLQQTTMEETQSQAEYVIFKDVRFVILFTVDVIEQLRRIVVALSDGEGRGRCDAWIHNLNDAISKTNI